MKDSTIQSSGGGITQAIEAAMATNTGIGMEELTSTQRDLVNKVSSDMNKFSSDGFVLHKPRETGEVPNFENPINHRIDFPHIPHIGGYSTAPFSPADNRAARQAISDFGQAHSPLAILREPKTITDDSPLTPKENQELRAMIQEHQHAADPMERLDTRPEAPVSDAPLTADERAEVRQIIAEQHQSPIELVLSDRKLTE